jgi:2-dehydro-3-deoxyphosphogluconate aldolase/(4S)-4-hydroxy-2-oxoglutarate aldolase
MVTIMDLLTQLRRRRLLAILRGNDPAATLAAVHILAEEGIDLIEVSLTSRDALTVIERARAELGDVASMGAGTVLTAADAKAAVAAGASFLVTPGLSAGAADGARLGVPVLTGALTPTEVAAAMEQGACAVKLFPAHLGGPEYLHALRRPFPDIPFVPVGGIDAAAALTYFDRGAVAVGVGSPLLGDALSGGALDELRERARHFRSVVEPT